MGSNEKETSKGGWEQRAQSPQSPLLFFSLASSEMNLSNSGSSEFLSVVGRLERLWDNGIEVGQDFWRETANQTKMFYSSSLESLQATNR